jgi:hypothetical protein
MPLTLHYAAAEGSMDRSTLKGELSTHKPTPTYQTPIIELTRKDMPPYCLAEISPHKE